MTTRNDAATVTRGYRRAPALTTVGGLLLAGAADASQGYDGPGPYLCWAIAALVAFRPRPWSLGLAAALSALLLGGGVVAPEVADAVTTPSDTLLFVSVIVQLAALAVTLVAAFAAYGLNRGTPAPRTLLARTRR